MSFEPLKTNAQLKAERQVRPVKRGTHRRRGRAIGMHMSTFWQMDAEDRQIVHAISRAGRQPT